MRIVSLLPGATETIFALGLGDSLVGVTHECDYPPEAKSLPRVTHSNLELDLRDSMGIDAAVAAAAASGRELYSVDLAAVKALKPDLVVAQDVCAVCAVPADQVAIELANVPMLRQHPHSLEDVLGGIEELAAACRVDGATVLANLRERIGRATRTATMKPRQRGVFLEWLDPPYGAGHWTPDLLNLAGIDDPLARPGLPSIPLKWKDVIAARPELLLLAPCGFSRDRADREAAAAEQQVRATGARRVVVFDGSAYFNRPGPRLVDSLELLVGLDETK